MWHRLYIVIYLVILSYGNVALTQERNAYDDSLAQVLVETLCQKKLDQIVYRGAIAKFCNACSDPLNTQYYLDSIAQLRCHEHYDYLKYYLINRRASVLVNLRQYEEADNILLEVMNADIEDRYPWVYITPYIIRGWINAEKGRDGLALYFYNLGLELSEKHDDQRSKADILNRISLIHKINGNYNIALEYCKRGLKLCEQDEYCRYYPRALMETSNIYKELGDTLQYLHYLEKAIQARNVNKGSGTIGELHYFALLAEHHLYYNHLDSFNYYKDLAIEGYERYNYYSEAKDLELEGIRLDMRQGKYQFNQSVHQLFLESFTPDMFNQKLEYYDLIIAYTQEKDMPRLTSVLYEEKEILSASKETLIRENLGYLQEYMVKEIERNKVFLSIDQKSKQIRRNSFLLGLFTLFLGGASIAFYRLNRSLKTSKQEIDQANLQLASQNVELENAVDYKIFLIKEIHHRVKNNLQVIDSFLNLQRYTLEEDVEHQFIDMAQERIQAMAITYNILYDQGLESEIEIKHYLSKLMSGLKDAQEGNLDLHLEVNAQECHVGIDKVHSLGMLLAEVFSNAIKHAFPRHVVMMVRPSIYLRGQKLDNQYQIVVGDNGIGLSTKQDRPTMGMDLINVNAERMNATITKESKQGLIYTITFPTP